MILDQVSKQKCFQTGTFRSNRQLQISTHWHAHPSKQASSHLGGQQAPPDVREAHTAHRDAHFRAADALLAALLRHLGLHVAHKGACVYVVCGCGCGCEGKCMRAFACGHKHSSLLNLHLQVQR